MKLVEMRFFTVIEDYRNCLLNYLYCIGLLCFSLHLAHNTKNVGRISTDARKLNRIVKAVKPPNCWIGGIKAKTSIPKPAIVVVAAPNKAVPVLVTVLLHASSMYDELALSIFSNVTFPSEPHFGQVILTTSPGLPEHT